MRTRTIDPRIDEIDVLVVGAGPAGTAAARGLATAGARVLLVDKAEFPRWKVCGCCLNGAALRTLTAMGLAGLPDRLGAPRLKRIRIAARGHAAELALPDGAAVSRVAFDQALIAEAVTAGADFRAASIAAWIEESADDVRITLRAEGESSVIRARVVIAADGLAAGFTRRIPGVQTVTARHTRIGAGATIDAAPWNYDRGVIHMAVGSGGYVGLVRVEDDRLNVAAAFDVAFVKAMGGLPHAARRVLADSGLPDVAALHAARWQGTPPLTRRYQPPPSERLFLVGDAAEYVEPFTGEGMAWALAGGTAVVRHAIAALDDDGIAAQNEWRNFKHESLRGRMRGCRWIAGGLRHPRLTGVAVRLLQAWPSLAGPYIRTLNRPLLGRG